MEFFLDTSDLREIAGLSELLPIDGVTTNPTILTKSGMLPEEFFPRLIDVLTPDQKIIAQVVATDFDGIMSEARTLSKLRGGENIVVKIPVSHVGYKAIRAAGAEGITVLATGIYSPDQAFWAAKAGADYLAPYVNRMCNYGDGVGQVAELIQTLRQYDMPAKVCAASFKNVDQVHRLLAAGTPAITVGPDVVRSMIGHPGTAIAVDEFSSNWKAAYGRGDLGL